MKNRKKDEIKIPIKIRNQEIFFKELKTISNYARYVSSFGLLRDLAKGIGNVAGSILGPIVGISVNVVASTLGITVAMVNEAIKAGCVSYEEIKDFHKL